MKKFSDSHEWVKVEGDTALVGITAHAKEELGEIVYVELPSLGKEIKAGEEVVVLESTKAAADIYSPISGKIVAINEHLKEMTEKVNLSPEEEGWLFKLKLSRPEELSLLLTEEQYKSLIT